MTGFALKDFAVRLYDYVWTLGDYAEMSRGDESDAYLRRVFAIHRRLGIPASYASRGFPLFREECELVNVRCGRSGELHKMTPKTAECFERMRAAASSEGVGLAVKWAFRSIADQTRIFRSEARAGKTIATILTQVAAPGFSEHHTGRAIDFELGKSGGGLKASPVFLWLKDNAAVFDFRMSYPRDNEHGFVYEPWHWFCCAE